MRGFSQKFAVAHRLTYIKKVLGGSQAKPPKN